jgi:hypothetical protein
VIRAALATGGVAADNGVDVDEDDHEMDTAEAAGGGGE